MTQASDASAASIYVQLRRGTWFGSLPPSLARALLDAGRSEQYQAGEVIYPEGLQPRAYLLFSMVLFTLRDWIGPAIAFCCTSLRQASGLEKLQRGEGREPWSLRAATHG